MSYDDLLYSGRIRKQKASKVEIRKALERADRDLRLARKMIAQDLDWGFAVAYNAVLQACRALMFSRGYRPSGPEAHKSTFALVSVALGKDFEELIAYFDRTRNKRNRAIYDVAGLITETEARNLLSKAADFVKLIRSMLKEKI